MKISKAKLLQIIKEELGTLREEDPAAETPRMSPSEAGAKWTEAEEIFKAAVYAAVDANLTERALLGAVKEVFLEIKNAPMWSGNKNPLREDDDTPRDPGLGLGTPADDEDGLDYDDGYPPEETQAAALKRQNRGK